MFSSCMFWGKGDKIEVNGREFMPGELSSSCLKITPKEYEEIYGLYQSAELILDKGSFTNHIYPYLRAAMIRHIEQFICLLSLAVSLELTDMKK